MKPIATPDCNVAESFSSMTAGELAFVRAVVAIGAYPSRVQEAMANHQILALLKRLCRQFPGTTLELTNQESWELYGHFTDDAQLSTYGYDEGLLGKPVTLLDEGYLLGDSQGLKDAEPRS